jgi:hypothetical protein
MVTGGFALVFQVCFFTAFCFLVFLLLSLLFFRDGLRIGARNLPRRALAALLSLALGWIFLESSLNFIERCNSSFYSCGGFGDLFLVPLAAPYRLSSPDSPNGPWFLDRGDSAGSLAVDEFGFTAHHAWAKAGRERLLFDLDAHSTQRVDGPSLAALVSDAERKELEKEKAPSDFYKEYWKSHPDPGGLSVVYACAAALWVTVMLIFRKQIRLAFTR